MRHHSSQSDKMNLWVEFLEKCLKRADGGRGLLFISFLTVIKMWYWRRGSLLVTLKILCEIKLDTEHEGVKEG